MVGLDVTLTGDSNSEHPGRASPPARSLVLYDADCGFCKWLLAGLLRWDRAARMQPIALGTPEADKLLHDLSSDERLASWHLISPGGERRSGGAAIPALLRTLPGGPPLAACFARIPRATDRGYLWVARHRSQLSKLIPERSKRHAGRSVQRRAARQLS